MTRDERLARPQQEPIVGSLPEVPGIGVAMRLTPGLGVHLRALADELLVNDYPGATVTRAEREMMATAVSAANDCFFCMDSHSAHASAVLEASGQTELIPLMEVITVGSDDGLSDKMQALLAIARTVGRNALDLTADDVDAALAAGATDSRRPTGRAHRIGVLDVQPPRGRFPRPHGADARGLPGTRQGDSGQRIQRPVGDSRPALISGPWGHRLATTLGPL